MISEDDIRLLGEIIEEISWLNRYESELFGDGYPQRLIDNDSNYLAILFKLVLIGELSIRLSKNFKDCHSEIVWKHVIALRNNLVHNYANVNREIIIKSLDKPVETLRKFCIEVLKSQVG